MNTHALGSDGFSKVVAAALIVALAGLTGPGLYELWSRRAAKERAWQGWKFVACRVTRIDRGSWFWQPDRVCRYCETKGMLITEAYKAGVTDRFKELGGAYALMKGVTVCE